MRRSRPRRSLLLLGLLLFSARGAAAADTDEVNGTWESRLPIFGDVVRFDLTTDDGERLRLTLSPEELDGLTREDLKTTGKALRFSWVRDAAALRFEGTGRWFGRPSGRFRLEPNAAYLARLAAIGCPAPSPRELLRLQLGNVPVGIVASLQRAGYERLDVDELIRLETHGVDGEYIEGMQPLGYRPDVDELIRLRTHGLEPSTARRLAELGVAGLPVDDLIRLQTHGIDPAYLRGMADAGIAPSAVDDLVRLRTHDLGPQEVAAMHAVDGFDLSVDDLIRLHTHGIGADYLSGVAEAREELTVDELCRLHAHGIVPGRYVSLAGLGYGGVDEVVELTTRGVDPGMIRGLAELGYDGLGVADLVRLKTHGVDAEFVRPLVEAGYERLSVDELIRLRVRGGNPLEARRDGA